MRSVADPLLNPSVLIAFAIGELHQVDEDALLSDAAVSAVNLAEFRSVLLHKEVEAEDIGATIRDFNLKVLPFGQAEAAIPGDPIPRSRPLSIGLGDCACIVTGMANNIPVWTGDRDWLKLGLDTEIKLIR
jgi:PIN domain nuclease of toxin-antitoxin system